MVRKFSWNHPQGRVTSGGHYWYFHGSNPRNFSECTKSKASALAKRFTSDYPQYLYRVIPFETPHEIKVYMVYMRMRVAK
jgi:hypothetical protein